MLANATGVPGEDLASTSAIMLGVLCYIAGLMSAHALDGWRGVRRSGPYVLVVGTAMGAAQYITAVNGLWTIGAISGGLVGLAASVVWIRFFTTEKSVPLTPSPLHGEGESGGAYGHTPLRDANESANGKRAKPSVRLAWSGYIILVILALLLRGIAPVKEFLGQWAVAIDIPATTTDRDWTVEREADAGFG
jgi:L-lactate permease